MTEHLALELKVGSVDDAGTFEGIASVFGELDGLGDQVAPGAFKKSLAAHKRAGRQPLMLWSHDLAQPIGRWTDIKETSEGLTVKGKLLLDVARAREVYAMLRERVADGLSIGFRTVDSVRTKTGRLLKEIDLAEISVVSLPALASARVLSVKGDAMSLDVSLPDDAAPAVIELPPEVLERITTAETKAAELAAKVDRLETKLARPSARVETRDDGEVERKAFNSYLRRGWDGIADMERKVLSAGVLGSPSADGFALVPQTFLQEILKNLVLLSPMRQVARVQNVGGGGPVLIPRRVSTLSAAWVDELASHNTSEPTYDQVSVPLFEARVTSEISNQLLEDAAFDMGAELARDFAEQFAFLEGQAFVAGTGTGQPQGFTTAATFPVTSVGALTGDILIDLYHSVATAYANVGTWLMNRNTMGAVRKLKAGGTNEYIWVDSIAVDDPPRILGRPVLEMPALANTGTGSPAPVSVAFGDWSQAYRIFDRVNLEVLRDPFTRARNSIVAFHARRRVGGALVKAEAVRGLSS
jgi:HK97 family phage major capsid protein/HK97 family phage prohead protease